MFEAEAGAIMTALPEIPGIIDGAMTITPELDGKISFRVLIGANGEQADRCDCIELVINSEYVRQALAATKVRRPFGAPVIDELPTFPCHIGLKLQ
jgi:hypothetical protein